VTPTCSLSLLRRLSPWTTVGAGLKPRRRALVAVAGAAAEEPVVVSNSVADAVEAQEAAVAAALKAEVEQLRAKISTLGQWPRLDLDFVLLFPLFGAMLIETSNLCSGAGLTWVFYSYFTG
jgi:hypothetical protein